MCPPSGFWPRLLLNPSDGPGEKCRVLHINLGGSCYGRRVRHVSVLLVSSVPLSLAVYNKHNEKNSRFRFVSVSWFALQLVPTFRSLYIASKWHAFFRLQNRSKRTVSDLLCQRLLQDFLKKRFVIRYIPRSLFGWMIFLGQAYVSMRYATRMLERKLSASLCNKTIMLWSALLKALVFAWQCVWRSIDPKKKWGAISMFHASFSRQMFMTN